MIDAFLLYAFLGLALASSAAMLALRHPMHVALALVTAMLALAGVYAMLGAHAVAVFQVLIYVGAVMVFMVYVIMLLDVRDASYARRYTAFLWPAAIGAAALLAFLGHEVWQGLAPFVAGEALGVQAFSVVFLNEYWVAFEVVSVLLVAAVVGALAVVEVGRARRG
ncbi:NADH-quinone oxidoreductase subunit J family protein [Usitatibacter palustris]|uniref:NADH-quinone oxidoreductase subunit J n=1 Tax=Usitatibacter palustris TaxID=2732487 RepID=A0A6M4H3M8_9PROT|nr:NADH-quinone oxidoreductase subunit J [Usitatibacter palustris]QJR14211.1 NADH-quinone oxidoreductase subunit J [Usitatibacter palustris]